MCDKASAKIKLGGSAGGGGGDDPSADYMNFGGMNSGGNQNDPNWMNNGAFDDNGAFSSDGGAAGRAFWAPAEGSNSSNHSQSVIQQANAILNDPTMPDGANISSSGTVSGFNSAQDELNVGAGYLDQFNAWGTNGFASSYSSSVFAYDSNPNRIGPAVAVGDRSDTWSSGNLENETLTIHSTRTGNKGGGNGDSPIVAELVGSIIAEADNGLTAAGGIRYMQTGEEALGALKWADKVTGLASIGNNLYKAWNERKTNRWQAALHFSEAFAQGGIMLFGGEEVELAWNLGSIAIDTGIDYYNDSHRK